MKTTSTPTKTNKALIKNEEAENVDVHLYKSMIGSLMYLTASRPGIMFAVCACVRFQVTPKTSHLHAVKRIFRYLKGQPKLGLWYPRDSPFDLEAFSDSDYAGASLDRKSTTGAEYVATTNCRGQVLWIQNQMLDYGFNFINTKIYIDNESTICIVKNPVFHSKTKHIEIRHHFIRDSYKKKLIQVIKIHTDHNITDLLIKAFDVSSMVAYLEKSDENAEFHQIVDFLSICLINYTLTVSPTIYASYIEHFWNTATSKIVNLVKQIHAIVDGKVVVTSESSVRNDLLFDVEDGITCLTNDDIFENLALMGYEQLSTKLTFTTKRIGTGGIPRCQKTIGGALAQTRSERVLKQPNEPPLPEGHTSGSGEGRMAHTFELMDSCTSYHPLIPPSPREVHTPGSDEGRLKLEELMAMCTKLSKQVLDLEKEKDAQAVEILKLKKRVKKLERQGSQASQHQEGGYTADSDFDGLDDMENVEGETVYAATSRVSTAKALVSTARPTVSTAGPSTSAVGTSTSDWHLHSDARVGSVTALEELAQVERRQRERVAQEESSIVVLYEEYDTIQASIDVDALFAARL
ncbi:hypothetical protein Tco_0198915 [Tanacetum coccineum]